MRECHVEQRIQPLQPASLLGKQDQEMFYWYASFFIGFLNSPGNESGQTKLIRRGNIIECHQVRFRW